MQPTIVLPVHDPKGLVLPFLWKIEPDLKQLFNRAFVGLTTATVEQQEPAIRRLQADPFNSLTYYQPDTLPGEHYRAIYNSAVAHEPADQTVHFSSISCAWNRHSTPV